MARRKYKKHIEAQQPEDSELWLISYADMVTLLLGFFVILFSLSAVDDQKFTEMSREVAKTMGSKEPPPQQQPDDAPGEFTQGRQLRALQLAISMMQLGQSMEDGVEKIEKIAAQKQDRKGVQDVIVQELERIKDNFDLLTQDPKEATTEVVLPVYKLLNVSETGLSDQGKELLKKIAISIIDVSDLVGIEVIGYSDVTDVKENVDQWTLSARWAALAAGELAKYGIARDKVGVSGMGNLHPLLSTKTSSMANIKMQSLKNRRIVVKIRSLKRGEIGEAH